MPNWFAVNLPEASLSRADMWLCTALKDVVEADEEGERRKEGAELQWASGNSTTKLKSECKLRITMVLMKMLEDWHGSGGIWWSKDFLDIHTRRDIQPLWSCRKEKKTRNEPCSSESDHWGCSQIVLTHFLSPFSSNGSWSTLPLKPQCWMQRSCVSLQLWNYKAFKLYECHSFSNIHI